MRSLEEQATRDYLTGAYNRRAAEERLADGVERARRGGGTLSLTLFDLDGLKSINDERGHRVGDACLVRFAEVLGRNLRGGLYLEVGRRRVRGWDVEHAGKTDDGAAAGTHRRRPAPQPRGASRRRADAPHLQRGRAGGSPGTTSAACS